MVVRKRKKKNKLRGKRTHGKGNTKNKRGAGCKGGRGRAGSKKHKKMLYALVEGRKYRLKPKPKGKAITIEELNKIVEDLKKQKKVSYEGDYILIDGKALGFEKILARGVPEEKMKIINAKPSERAKNLLLDYGSVIEEVAEAKKEASSEK